MTKENLKVPPQSLESEQSLLGAILIDPDSMDKINNVVNSEDFYHGFHRVIFEHMQMLSLKSEPIDISTIINALKDSQWSEKIETGYIHELADNVASSANIKHYAKIVSEKSQLRKLLASFNQSIEEIFNPCGMTTKEIMEEAEARILKVSERGTRSNSGFQDLKPILLKEIEHIQKLYESDGDLDLLGLTTGFKALDEKILGLQGGDLIVLAARPSMGKTTLALNFAENIAALGKGIGIFSMEMGASQLANRLIGSAGRINLTKLRTGKLESRDWDKVSTALAKLAESKIYIDETPSLSTIELRSRARRLKREKQDLSLIIVDYLQLANATGKKNDNRTNEVSEISRSLKALAKELSVPVIALSQLNRGLEQRQNKRPIMSDLRESGAIEQDADMILFIYRDEVYNPDTDQKGTAEIIIGKNRNGEIGNVRLAFIAENTRFENLPDNWFPEKSEPEVSDSYHSKYDL